MEELQHVNPRCYNPRQEGFHPLYKLSPAPERQRPGPGSSAPAFPQPRGSARATPRCLGGRRAARQADRSQRPHLALPHCRAQWPCFQRKASPPRRVPPTREGCKTPGESRALQPLGRETEATPSSRRGRAPLAYRLALLSESKAAAGRGGAEQQPPPPPLHRPPPLSPARQGPRGAHGLSGGCPSAARARHSQRPRRPARPPAAPRSRGSGARDSRRAAGREGGREASRAHARCGWVAAGESGKRGRRASFLSGWQRVPGGVSDALLNSSKQLAG